MAIGVPASESRKAEMADAIKAEELRRLTSGSSGIENFFWGLDTLDATARSAVDFLQDGTWNNPLDPNQRVTGEQIVANAGLKSGNGALDFATGLATEMLLSPTNLISGPLGALRPAGKAAKAAGLLDNAATIASKRVVAAPTAEATRIATAMGSTPADYLEHAARPLVGPRVAQKSLTIQDLIDEIADPVKKVEAQRGIDDYARTQGLTPTDLQGPLGADIGVDYLAGSATGSLPGGDKIASALDSAGDRIMWSPALRFGSQLFDKNVAGRYDAEDQAMAMRFNTAGAAGDKSARLMTVQDLNKLRDAQIPDAVAQATGIKSVTSPESFAAIDRLLEGVAHTKSDEAYLAGVPEVAAYVDALKNGRFPQALADSKEWGLRANQLKHPYGAGYRPYQADASVAGIAIPKEARKQSLFSPVTADMLARDPNLALPGGIDQLRYYSTDKRFVNGRGLNAAGVKYTDAEVADILQKEVLDPNSAYWSARQNANSNYAKLGTMKYTPQQAKAMAQLLNQLPGDAPILSNSTLDAQSRYLGGRYRQIAMTPEVLDTLASKAVEVAPKNVPGGNSVNLITALNQLALTSPNPELKALKEAYKAALATMPGGKKPGFWAWAATQDASINSHMPGFKAALAADPALRFPEYLAKQGDTRFMPGGASDKLRAAVAKRVGKNPEDIRLSNYSIPSDLVSRMKEVDQYYQQPKAASAIREGVDQFNRLFKAQVLLWPSRYTRDLMSGFVSNTLEAGADKAAWGYQAATKILNGDKQATAEALRGLERYKGIADDKQLLDAFYEDIGTHKVLTGISADLDKDAGIAGQSVTNMLPGVVPKSASQILTDAAGKMVANKGMPDYFGIQGVAPYLGVFGHKANTKTTGALYKAGEEMANYTDDLNRLGGFLAMMSNGLAPAEAAKRIASAHVVYDDLSEFERGLRRLDPFYAYNRGITKWGVKALQEPQSKLMRMYRVNDRLTQSDEDAYTPQTIRDSGGFAIPKWVDTVTGLPLADLGDGRRGYISNLDLPTMGVANLASIRKQGNDIDWSGTASATASNFLKRSAPLTKAAMELAFQRDSFSKQPLGQRPTSLENTLTAVLPQAVKQYMPQNTEGQVNLPTLIDKAVELAYPAGGRVFGFTQAASDMKSPSSAASVGNALFNTFSPVKFRAYGQETINRDAMRVLDDQFRTYGVMEMPLVSDEDVEKMSPSLRRNYEIRKGLQQVERERRKARAAGQ